MKRKRILKESGTPSRKRRAAFDETDVALLEPGTSHQREETLFEKIRRYHALEKMYLEMDHDLEGEPEDEWDDAAHERVLEVGEEYRNLAVELAAAGVDVRKLNKKKVESNIRKLQMLRDKWRDAECKRLHEEMSDLENALHSAGVIVDSDWPQKSSGPVRLATRVRFNGRPDIAFYNPDGTP
jgi:hypothetical protein